MNISDKKFIEFADRIWERNKELIEENRALKQDILQYVDRINKLKDELEFEKAFSRDSHSQNINLRKDLEEVNSRCNEVMDQQYDYIRQLEDRLKKIRVTVDTITNPENDIPSETNCAVLDDWDELFEDCEDDSESSDCFINCTFNINN